VSGLAVAGGDEAAGHREQHALGQDEDAGEDPDAQAGARIAVLTAVLVLAERVLLPLAKSLVSAGQRER
jgi:hypothetical protein